MVNGAIWLLLRWIFCSQNSSNKRTPSNRIRVSSRQRKVKFTEDIQCRLQISTQTTNKNDKDSDDDKDDDD